MTASLEVSASLMVPRGHIVLGFRGQEDDGRKRRRQCVYVRIRTTVIDVAWVLVNVHATFSRADACVTLREGGNSCGNGATQKYQLGIIPFRCNNERAYISEKKRQISNQEAMVPLYKRLPPKAMVPNKAFKGIVSHRLVTQ